MIGLQTLFLTGGGLAFSFEFFDFVGFFMCSFFSGFHCAPRTSQTPKVHGDARRAYDWPREGPIAIARPRREAGLRPNRACAVCVLHHQLAECNPVQTYNRLSQTLLQRVTPRS